MSERENITKAYQTACMLSDDVRQIMKGRISLPEPPQGRSPEHHAMVAYLGIIAQELASVVNKLGTIS